MRIWIVLAALLAFPGSALASGKAPLELAGLRLGGDIAQYAQFVNADSATKGFFPAAPGDGVSEGPGGVA